ncbi:hypothetical protein [Undibacterium sp. Tian12W]
MSTDSRDRRARPVKLTRTGHTRLPAVLSGYYRVIDTSMQKQEFAP